MSDLQECLPLSADKVEHMSKILTFQRAAFCADRVPSADVRIGWLVALRRMLIQNKSEIIQAINADFGNRSTDETLLAEIIPSLRNIDYAMRNLRKWMRPSKRSVAFFFQTAPARVLYQPLGVVGVIAAWNYPLLMAIGPIVSAFSAGNRIMLKLSDITPLTSELLSLLLGRHFSEDLIKVYLGSTEVDITFSRLPFDYLFFSGASSAGRHVMRAAADNLTPVTLELGGKSPVIISETVSMAQAAERIAFAKAMSAGQTCVSPDYVLVPRSLMKDFVVEYQEVMQRFFPSIEDNPDYTTIINELNLSRLASYLMDAEMHGAMIIPVFPMSEGKRLPHVLVLNATDDMRLMREVIAGPLLPIIIYDKIEEAIDYVAARARPPAIYYFGHDKREQERVLFRTRSKVVCFNDTLATEGQCGVLFGSIGLSRMGCYHGRESFLMFSQARSVFAKGHINIGRLAYPPYGKVIQKIIYWLYFR